MKKKTQINEAKKSNEGAKNVAYFEADIQPSAFKGRGGGEMQRKKLCQAIRLCRRRAFNLRSLNGAAMAVAAFNTQDFFLKRGVFIAQPPPPSILRTAATAAMAAPAPRWLRPSVVCLLQRWRRHRCLHFSLLKKSLKEAKLLVLNKCVFSVKH